MEIYEDFYQYKVKVLNNRPSVKDYKSLQNALTEYAAYTNTVLTFERLNTVDFMADFRHWLAQPHGNKKNQNKKGKTKGNLNDNTINKRFSCLKTFYSWCEIKKIYLFDKAVSSFKTPKYENDIFALSKEDIKLLQKIKTDNTNWQQVLDLFIFNCFVGLRYSDLINLSVNNYITDYRMKKAKELIYIENENKKTGIVVQIPLQKTPLKILEKYNNKLPTFSSQYFNREIKNILEHYDLFNDIVIKKKRQLKEKKDYPILRRKLISSHSCRRTFITLGIEANIPINSLMLASGHTKLQTIKKYMKLNQNKKAFLKIDLE